MGTPELVLAPSGEVAPDTTGALYAGGLGKLLRISLCGTGVEHVPVLGIFLLRDLETLATTEGDATVSSREGDRIGAVGEGSLGWLARECFTNNRELRRGLGMSKFIR